MNHTKNNLVEFTQEQNQNKRDGPSQKKASLKRITVQFSKDLYENLQWISDEQGGIALAEAVRKAVMLEFYLRQQLKEKDTKLLIEYPDSVRELIIR